MTDPTDHVPAELYSRIQQFYARQMGLLDDGRADDWADTFTEDAVFQEASRLNEPLRGRDAIRESSRARKKRLEADKLDFRHWLGMLTVTPREDGSLQTRAYALAMRVPAGGELDIFASVVCHDQLVLTDGTWQVRHRDLHHDGSGRD
ncbi:nuclear transport factor 2 family protein [Streptomyces cyaneofuscatus]|uniref:nuclear transport factor 2 family protein n=1 Tax=Streptomyces TaxID=1883 RepID=UPI0004CC4FE9|nr:MULTISPECIES: nuclear transport factor 2 family protein [Streptomyces]MYW30227.1 nuclear transport factor 2 family protein [Streptomyces sp. SID2119]ONI53583.1 Anthranilate 1,2-dioxygenase small subunit [Streptomyces sp. IB2014 011-1]RDV47955.1 nuclear transport factor 2 family protein [Streptomyces sp. IB2014 011-12]CAD5988796.1 Nuclear transport factor 2 family protein [Streptomyces sp. KY75]